MSTQHKALILPAKLGKFEKRLVDTQKPGRGELLVKVAATALNPVDWKIQKYGGFVETYPTIIGTDIAGEVVQVGEGVSNFSIGDRVLYQGSWGFGHSGFQQYSLAEAELTAKIPTRISYEQAASIPVSLSAAFVGLYNDKPHGGGLTSPLEPSGRGNYAGKPLLIIGGASAVGQFAIELGKLSGFSQIITTAAKKHEPYLKSLGATHIIDRSIPLSSNEIEKITMAPLEIVFDAISSSETQQAGYDLVAPGGQFVSVLPSTVTETAGKSTVAILAIWTLPETRQVGLALYKNLTALLEEGAIVPNNIEVVPGGLDGVPAGLERVEAGVSALKLVVRPQDTE